MDINRNNYEAYLLDLMEGRLSVLEQQKIRDFLRLNPDCALPLEEMEPWVLEAEELLFPAKGDLKREFPHSESGITESNFDLFSIARLEGDLTPGQERDHQEMIESDEWRGLEWRQWQHTRLSALPMEYQGKASLRRKVGFKGGILWLSILSSAAAVALLLVLLRVDPNPNGIPVAESPPEQAPYVTDQTSVQGLKESESEERTDLQELTGETLDKADIPVLFSVKKKNDKPLEVNDRRERIEKEVTQDRLLVSMPEKVEPRPLRLANHIPVTIRVENSAVYDQIKPLDIPPAKASVTHNSLVRINEMDMPEASEKFKEEKEISIWTIANTGIKGINKITGADMSLLAAKDENGDLSGFMFKSKRFSVSLPIEKSK